MELLTKIEQLIKEEIEKMGYYLKRVEIKRRGRGKELIIVVDKEGGITIEDCAKISKRIDPILEKADIFEGRWYLTVSSPGLSEEEIKKLKF